MDTILLPSELGVTLFGKTRRAVLGVLFRDADAWMYLREVARISRASLGAVQRELAQLTAAGILERQVRGRQVFFRANRACPIFAELTGMVVKTIGMVDVLRTALMPVADRIQCAFVYGSWARGDQQSDSDVDVVLIGDVSFAAVVSALRATQEMLGREVNPSVYSAKECRAKLTRGDHFLQTVWREPKIMLIGGDRELASLAQERLAGRAQEQHARDSRPVGRRRPRSA